MINKFAIGFAAVAAVAVAGVDYISQAQALDKGPGEFSIAAYTRTVSTRIGVFTQPAPKGPQVAARTHLPAAPEGWQRRAWSPQASGASVGAGTTDAKLPMDDMARARAEREVWEYVGPKGSIRLSAAHTPGVGKSFARKLAKDPASANVLLQNSGRPTRIAEIAGVTYYAAERDEFDSTGDTPVYLRGYIGDDIALTAYAEGNRETLLNLLLAIDYDALNAMQDDPAPDIGSEAAGFDVADRGVFLSRASRLERNAKRAARAAKPEAPAQETANRRLNVKDKKGGFFSGLSGTATDKAGTAAKGAKRLQLDSGSCRDSRVGKFCGTD